MTRNDLITQTAAAFKTASTNPDKARTELARLAPKAGSDWETIKLIALHRNRKALAA